MEITQRQSYLDWLRIFSIAGVLILHSAMPYAANLWWHIRNAETSPLLQMSNFFLHLFRMPLLFFISGTVSFYMMQRRSATAFIRLRFTRLFIPILVGMFVIVPPQIYMERLTQGYQGNYWDFYKTVFRFEVYPEGNLSWHHLWFIVYLFVYDVIFAPLFMWFISPKSERFKKALNVLCKGKRVFLLAIPSIVWYSLLSERFPETFNLIQDGCYFVYWLLFLLAGFFCILQPTLMDSLQRNRRFAVAIGFISLLILYYIKLNAPVPESRWNDLRGIIFTVLWPVTAWSWVFGIVGYGKRYLNRDHSTLKYLNQAAYPFYILHQTVIVILAYYLTRNDADGVGMKYVYTVGITLFVTTGIFHFFIKPFPVMRFLFGMKADSSKSTKAKENGALAKTGLHKNALTEKENVFKEGAMVKL